MNNSILSANINLFGGVISGRISFNRGLNIISGENGTCKTQVLGKIRSGNEVEASDRDEKLRIVAFSPKRNSERKTIEKIYQEMRQQNRYLQKYVEEKANLAFQDSTFTSYASFAELYFLAYEELCKDGQSQADKMDEVAVDFDRIIKKIFPNYDLSANWNSSSGCPEISIEKWGINIPVESLSLGEQEVLSLVFNLYASRENNDVFLIDEPEIHLNWHLEEALFNFFDWFCNVYDKQIIVVTHSRVVFKPQFLSRTIFLYWDDGHIVFGHNIPDEQRDKIAGESIDIIKQGYFPKPTFFVEDKAHQAIIEIIAEIIKADILVSQCGSSSNVISLFRYSIGPREGDWKNCYFVVDGDNQENPCPDKEVFIHLDKYSIENYLLDFDTAAKVTGRDKSNIQDIVFQQVKGKEDTILKKNKFFRFLFDRLSKDDINESSLAALDCSIIIDSYLCELGMEFNEYTRKYVDLLNQEGRLEEVFPQNLISAIKKQL